MAASKEKSTRSEQENAIDLLIADHERVKKLFKQFQKIKDGDDQEACIEVVESACAELRVHSMIEEEIFYPAVRSKADKELKDQLNEADVEHGSIDQLIDKLAEIDPSDDMYKAHFTVISEYVQHHVQEEEKEMFPKVRKLKGLDLDELAIELRARKEELMGDFFEAEEEPTEEESAARRRGGDQAPSPQRRARASR